MLKKLWVIIFFIFLSALSTYLYLENKLPEGVVPMGNSDETYQFIRMLTAIISLFIALIGLFQKLVELKNTNSGDLK